MDAEQYDANVLVLYKQFKSWSNGENLNTSTIISLVTLLIPAVQKLITEHHQGSYKKKVIINVLELIIKDSNLDQNAKDSLELLIHTTIPITIDAFISIAKGDIDIGKLTQPFKSCCTIG